MSRGQLHTLVRHLRRAAAASGDGLTDAQLIDRWTADRDEAAFELLVCRHGPMVWNVCRRVLRHDQDAEDAFQATFLTLVRKAGAIGKRDAVGSWLHRVAYRAALAARARVASHAVRQLVGSEPTAAASQELLWRDLGPVLDQEVNRLPEKYRAPFVLCHLQGKTNEEAARELRCPTGTVLSRLAWARERLRARLTRRGVTPFAGVLAALPADNAFPGAAPAALVKSTVRAAPSFAAGRVAGAVSARAADLTGGVIRAMSISRRRILAVVLLGLVCAGTGAGVLTHLARGEKPPAEGQEAPQPAAPPPAEAKAPREQPKDTPQAAAGPERGKSTWQQKAILKGSKGAIVAVAFAPDGKALAAGGGDHLYLWRLATEQLRFTLKGHGGNTVSSVAFSPDGKLVGVGAWDMKVWSADTGEEVAFLGRQDMGRSWPVAFAPDGKTLATGYGPAVKLWDVATWQERASLAGHTREVNGLAFARDGKTLATAGSDGTVKLWDFATGKERTTLKLPKAAVNNVAFSVAFSPDGKTLAVGTGGFRVPGEVVLWDVASAKVRTVLKGHELQVTSVAFSPDGKTLASGSYDQTVRLWDVASGETLATLKGHPGEVQGVAFSPDGRALASVSNGWEGTVRLWSLRPVKEP
jgi:RNA polymerase sigma factor (sigma-70 family)